jgi:hypothetical protein
MTIRGEILDPGPVATSDTPNQCVRKWKSNPTNNGYKAEYSFYRNKINKLIKKAKSTYHQKMFNQNLGDIKKTWDSINFILGRKCRNNCDEIVLKYFSKNKTNKEIANQFVTFFTESIQSMLHECSFGAIDIVQTVADHSMYLPRTQVTDIIDIVSKLKNSAPGADNIRMSDIKQNVGLLAPVITRLINLIIEKGIIPEQLKHGVVRPIYKSEKNLWPVTTGQYAFSHHWKKY